MNALLRFVARKTVRLFILLAAVSALSFTLVSLSPIDPIDAYVRVGTPTGVTPAQREMIAERWGLNDPPFVRYLRWLGQMAQGNLGNSMVFNQPVATVIGSRFLTSIGLMGIAWLMSGCIGFVTGVIAGAWRDSLADRIIRWYAYTLASTPVFWMGLLLLILFSVWLRITPVCCVWPIGSTPEETSLWTRLHHLLLPAATLSIMGVANVTLHTRQKLIEVLHSDYVLFARAQGEKTAGIIWHHGLRNIALPAITLQFAYFSELFGGSVLTEQVFGYPGLGEATVKAGVRGDAPLLLGIALFSAAFVFVGNSMADLVYEFVDPRIRLRGDI